MLRVDEAAFFREHGWIALRGLIRDGQAAALAREVDRVFPESRMPADRVHEFYWHSASPSLPAFKLSSVGRLRGLPKLNCNPESDSISVFCAASWSVKAALIARKRQILRMLKNSTR